MNYQSFEKKAGETRTFIVSFSRKLQQSGIWPENVHPYPYTSYEWPDTIEVLSGTPTASEQQTSDLTITNVAINTDPWVIDHNPHPANHGVQMTIAGGTARHDYTIRVSVTTDSSPVQTLIEDVRLRVL